MSEPLLIRPNGPRAIVGILLNEYYSTEAERWGLVQSLLTEINQDPEHLDCIGTLLRRRAGRRVLKMQITRAYEKFALYAQPKDCLVVYCELPETEKTGRIALLKTVCKLGRALVDDAKYREMFTGKILFAAERRLLHSALGEQVLLDRLLRTAKERPALRLAAG